MNATYTDTYSLTDLLEAYEDEDRFRQLPVCADCKGSCEDPDDGMECERCDGKGRAK